MMNALWNQTLQHFSVQKGFCSVIAHNNPIPLHKSKHKKGIHMSMLCVSVKAKHGTVNLPLPSALKKSEN